MSEKKPKDGAIEPEVVAAIALALAIEDSQDARARELAAGPSIWTVVGRARQATIRGSR